MSVEIQFFAGKKEPSFPIIKVTKSRNGKTGTATFLFLNPKSFEYFFYEKKKIETVFLIREEKRIQSTDIQIFFKDGKPFLLKSIFIFKNSTEWFDFLTFMNHYSKEKGFFFQSKNF
jgi:photosystem II protein